MLTVLPSGSFGGMTISHSKLLPIAWRSKMLRTAPSDTWRSSAANIWSIGRLDARRRASRPLSRDRRTVDIPDDLGSSSCCPIIVVRSAAIDHRSEAWRIQGTRRRKWFALRPRIPSAISQSHPMSSFRRIRHAGFIENLLL